MQGQEALALIICLILYTIKGHLGADDMRMYEKECRETV